MRDESIRKIINQYGEDNDAEIVLLENPAFDRSIIGISHDNKVIYDYTKMIQEMADEDHIDYIEAEEFIQYNTLRALPYFDNAPIILFGLPEID